MFLKNKIHSFLLEKRHIFLFLVLAFFISYSYTVLKPIKDTLVLFPGHSGGEVIPFLKTWGVFPFSLLFTLLFIYFSSRFSQGVVLALFLLLFSAYFALFSFFLFPYQDQLHLNQTAKFLEKFLPIGFRGFISMIRYWNFSLFYIIAEMWGVVIVHLTFWNFVIHQIEVKEAKKNYGWIIFSFNLGSIAAGITSSSIFSYTGGLQKDWDDPMKQILLSIVIVSLLILSIFYRIHLRHHNLYGKEEESLPKESEDMHEDKLADKKSSFSIWKSLCYLSHSRYLLYITLIVLSYNVVNFLLEIVCKSQIRLLYENPSDYCTYYGRIIFWIGIFSAAISILFLTPMMHKLPWQRVASIPPLIIICVGIVFLALSYYREFWRENFFQLWRVEIEYVILYIGSFLMIAMRVLKYTFFDSTKELALTPLSREAKIQGKAVIDGISSRLGKSGASLLYQALLILCTSFFQTLPYVGIIISLFFFIWMISIRKIGRRFHTYESMQAKKYV